MLSFAQRPFSETKLPDFDTVRSGQRLSFGGYMSLELCRCNIEEFTEQLIRLSNRSLLTENDKTQQFIVKLKS